MISLRNTIAHTLIFNIKGKTIYNAGLANCWLLFVPCIYFYNLILLKDDLVSTNDLLIGIPLGVALNYIGVLKMIAWLADKKTPYIFA